MSGSDVEGLQTFLSMNAYIYPEAAVTGYFGPLTQAAVQRFQTAQGVVSAGTPATTGYGVVGPNTRISIAHSCAGATSATTSPTVQANNTRSSLLSVASRHLKEATAGVPGAALFEIQTSLTWDEIEKVQPQLTNAFSSFVMPNDNTKYLEVDEWFDKSITGGSYSVDQRPYVVPQPSGTVFAGSAFSSSPRLPQSYTEHSPLTGWHADIGTIALSLKQSIAQMGNIDVDVTTAGRARSKYANFFPQQLSSLPDDDAIVVVTGWLVSDDKKNQFAILSANDAKVLASGYYTPLQSPA
jgi:hypothetical protein